MGDSGGGWTEDHIQHTARRFCVSCYAPNWCPCSLWHISKWCIERFPKYLCVCLSRQHSDFLPIHHKNTESMSSLYCNVSWKTGMWVPLSFFFLSHLSQFSPGRRTGQDQSGKDCEWPTSTSRKQLQRFLGFANFYYCFKLQPGSHISHPRHLHQDPKLNHLFTSDPVLIHPNQPSHSL